MSKIQELADRVERLLLRHDELQRTNALLEQQLGAVTHERDGLRSRLNAARVRIDALLERLPGEAAAADDSVTRSGTARSRP
jgi:cell division protein ZapB